MTTRYPSLRILPTKRWNLQNNVEHMNVMIIGIGISLL